MFGCNKRLVHRLSDYRGHGRAVVVLVVGAMGILPAAAAAQGVLQGVSCSSVGTCSAVGDHVTGTGPNLTLADRWNGTSWANQTTPNPAGATGSFLYGVSCPSASSCIAVGENEGGGGYMTLAERWNGTSWQVQSTPEPTGAQVSVLSGLSCASASVCIAVGDYTNAGGYIVALAERWNGTSWHIQSIPNPAGSTDTRLRGVSCTSASACTAVGFTENSGGTEVTLAERWNGTSWQIQAIPNPKASEGSVLDGVSCPSSATCTAVGYYENPSLGQSALAERWNGSSWQVHSTPNPAGGRDGELDGVSCASASVCTAVGNYAIVSEGESALAERWNGTSWKLQTTPTPAGAVDTVLNDVSCASVSVCTAVGNYINSVTQTTLAEHWNGTSWAIEGTPTP